VTACASTSEPEAHEAFAKLFQDYRYSVYAWFRQHGHNALDSEDLLQSFFLTLFKRKSLATADPDKGRFRNFLRGALKHFDHDIREHRNRQRRGGGVTMLPLDDGASEEWFKQSAGPPVSPDVAFDRHWAQTLLGLALHRLEAEQASADPLSLYSELRRFLVEEVDPGTCIELGARFGLKPNSIAVRIKRLRTRYRELLLREVGRTIRDPLEAQEELRALLLSLSHSSEVSAVLGPGAVASTR
jgi:RNA polymerase sigma-70 factor (ECF subfamily)